MKVSLNTIKNINQRYGCCDDVTAIGTDKLIEKIGAQLGGVDEVIKLGDKYQGIVIVKVVECVKHDNADKLSICRVDDGGVMQNVERGDDGLVQVICGAPNVHADMLAAWLPPGAIVPETVGKEPFVLEAREIRGTVSNGMLASPKELALGDSHEGILEIDGDYKPGTEFAVAFGLKDDIVLDIENKMFTHRPDCFGFLGIARELAGIQSMSYKSPEWYKPNPEFPQFDGNLPLKLKNELPELVPRFCLIVMDHVKVGPSPAWLVTELSKVGQKSINNIVDYTNWFMLETGQPLHAYDYDKVKALSENDPTIVVRKPREGEKVKLLNGKEVSPRSEAIMIATDKQLIGIGGVMGGSETEVDESTQRIILEAATFDMYSVRRTSMEHGLFTDAVTRFTKGQSPLQNLAVLAKIVNEITEFDSGHVASDQIDDNHIDETVLRSGSLHDPVNVTAEFINARLGFKLTSDEISRLLTNVEFVVTQNSDGLNVKAPFWRTDIELPEDVVEEVGRLYGYDKLPLELPLRSIEPTKRNEMFDLKARIRDELSRAGANEVLTYSFVPGSLLDKVDQSKDKAFQVANALSPDLQYYRMSLTPSLIEKVHMNVKAGYEEFALFEIGKAHVQGEMQSDEPDIPKEVNALSLVFCSRNETDYAAYYVALKFLDSLLVKFNIQSLVKLEPLDGADLYGNPWLEQMTAPFEPKRSSVLRDSVGLVWGVVGEYRPSVRKALKLPASAAGFEIDPLLLKRGKAEAWYMPLSRFPAVSQDITLRVPASTTYQHVFDIVSQTIGKLQPENSRSVIVPIDIYQSEQDSGHKNITLRLTMTHYDRTLTDKEVNSLLDKVGESAKTEIQAQRI